MNLISKSAAGFRELNHTADWELEVWAPNLPDLLYQAALGMYTLSNIQLKEVPTTTKSTTISADDPEEMLVSFLSELLFFMEDEGLASDAMDLSIVDDSLTANIACKPLASQGKEIKAVTYHNLSIVKTAAGYRTRIVFDV